MKWWDQNDNQIVQLMMTISEKMGAFQVESSEDELAQLKKMYKSEDLTNETADIVLKRAVRILDIYKTMIQANALELKKGREYQIKIVREQLATQVDVAKQSVAQTEATLKQQAVTRQTATALAKVAVDTAADKLADLQKDAQQFKVVSEIDGIVSYGSFRNKAWTAIPAEQMKPGEKVQAQQVLLTVWEPTKLKIVSDVAESKLTSLPVGSKVRISPAIMPDVNYDGSVEHIEPIGAAKGEQQAFDFDATLGPVDAKIVPGYKAQVTLPAGKSEEVLIVPTAAVSKGRVWVKVGEKEEARDVVVGRSDSTNVEIKSGLKEGEQVLKQAKK
jgi:multidrug resistance efflux pump